MSHTVTLISSNQKVCAALQEIAAAAGASITWELHDGSDWKAMMDSIARTKVALKGRLPAGAGGKTPATIRFRKELGIHTIVRHVKNIPGLPARADGVDLYVVREASEDIYSGFEHESTDGVFESVKVTTRAACDRISRFAFDLAVAKGRKKVTTVHKSNILKKADGMFLGVSKQVAGEYPSVTHDEVIVDALCMKLVRWPQGFDVLLCGNLFGDIVSDCAAGMAGGRTVACGVDYGSDVVVFENPHAVRAEGADEDLSTPYPAFWLTADLLAHLGEAAAAERVRKAVQGALEAGVYTWDIQGGGASLDDVRKAVLARL